MANASGQNIDLPSPLDSEKYLASPISTILESINDPQSEVITLHDLTEAYATLSRRIRLQAANLMNNRNFPALNLLYTHATSLSICLIRDVGRCLLNPLYIFSQHDSMSDDGSFLEEGTERAQSYATLSHHALVFLSDVFSFYPLMQSLSITQQSDLLREVLLILSTTHFPTPNAKKTWSLAAWVMISQNLHPDVLLPHKEVVKQVLVRCVNRKYDGHSFKVEGLKQLSALLHRQPREFLDCMLQLYPRILAPSEDDTLNVRIQALETLRSIVALKLDSPDSKWSRKIAKQTHSFIQSQSTKQMILQENALPNILMSAMKEEDSRWDHRGPLWAMLFVACLICISDAGTFTHGYSLKLFLSILAHAAKHKRTYVRALHPYIWNCLVWCYSRLPTAVNDPQTGQDLADIRKRAFLVLRQELKGGIPTALVASLLSFSPSTSEFTLVWELLKDLLSSTKESQVQEGIRLFCRVIAPAVQPSEPDPRNDIRDLSGIVFRDLFVRSFFDLPENQMRALLTRLPGPDVRFVRPLAEEQIRDHWKEIVDLWVLAVKCVLVSSVRFQQYEDQLLNAWKSLLFVQSQIHDSGNLTMSTSTVDKITSIFVDLVADTDSVSDQLCQLRLVHQLWSAMKQCCTTSLATMATTILSAVISHNYTLEGEIKAAWCTLCGDLISVGVPSFMYRLLAESDSQVQGGIEVQRLLWGVVGESELSQEQGKTWEEIISSLVVPIRSWSLDPREVSIWNRLFANAVKLEKVSSPAPRNTIDALFHRLGEDIRRLRNCPGLFPRLLRQLRLNLDNPSHLDFLGLTNEFLVKSYPPKPEDHILALPILDGIACLIQVCEDGSIIRLLSALDEGLCLWIKDENKSLLEQEHSTLVRDIYCTSLSVLSKLPPSLEILQTLSTFLCSSFERMGHPPIGPLAFERFWRSTYHKEVESFKGLIPENVKTCLMAWSDHCGDSLADGVNSLPCSSSPTRSYVPDSQSPEKAFFDHENYVLSDPMESDDIYDLVAPSSPALSQHTPTPGTPRGIASNDLSPMHRVSTNLVRENSSLRPLQETVIGRKRSNSQDSSQVNKRRRINDEINDDDSIFWTRSSKIGAPSTHVTSALSAIVMRRSGPSRLNRRSRRPFAPSSPRSEEFVPETSSPGADISRSPGLLEKFPTIHSRHDDDIIHDSTEMDELPPLMQKDDEAQNSERLKSPSYKRVQSEPVIEPSPPSRPNSLRRNHTTSERLNALKHAYTLVADSQGPSQVPIEELAHAAQLAHRIGAKIAERMSKQFSERL